MRKLIACLLATACVGLAEAQFRVDDTVGVAGSDPATPKAAAVQGITGGKDLPVTVPGLVTLAQPVTVVDDSGNSVSNAANQATANATLATIAADTTSIDGKVSTAANQVTGNASLSSIDADTSTIAGDTTSIDGKTPALGQAAMAASVPVAIASDQSAVPVSAAALPLPAGAATSANQVTGNASLATIAGDTTSIDGKITQCDTGAVTVDSSALPAGASTAANQATGNASLASIDGKLVDGNDIGDVSVNSPVTVMTGFSNGDDKSFSNLAAPNTTTAPGLQGIVPFLWDGAAFDRLYGTSANGAWVNVTTSVLPTNASTSALQTTGNASLATIDGDTTSIDGKTPALGQAAMAASVPVAIASDQSAVPISAAALPLPSGAATSANQTTGNASLATIAGDTTSIDGKITQCDTGAVTVDSSALPAGASTAANQTTGNNSLSDIDDNTDTGTTMDHAAVTVGNSASLILASASTTRRVTIINAFTDAVAIGNSDVTLNSAAATDGFVLAQQAAGANQEGTGGSFTTETTAAIYGIGASVNSKVIYLVESD